MPEEWWNRMSKGLGRFKDRGLQNEDKLKVMFENLQSTGADHWSASSGVAPSTGSKNSAIDLDAEDVADSEDEDSEPEELLIPTSGATKRGDKVLGNDKQKKPKTVVGHWLEDKLGHLVQASDKISTSVDSVARKEDLSGCSIKEVMKLVKECGVAPTTDEHYSASCLLTKLEEMEMFMTFETPEQRLDWLKRKHIFMTKNGLMIHNHCDDDKTLKDLKMMQTCHDFIVGSFVVVAKYYAIYLDKNPHWVPIQSGYSWVMETLYSPVGSQKMFRMKASLFYKLHDLLVSNYGLTSSVHITSIEALAIFLVTCGHGWSYSALHGTFHHSSETLSRKIGEVLNCMVAMCKHYIRPLDPNFSTTHPRISGDRRMMPFFKDCIGAVDGTHITVTPPPHDLIRYIGRSGKATQNVLAVVDFDLRITYASIGQPGSMHDTSVLYHAIENDPKFPHPPVGKFYNGDAGYPNRPGYLTPYKGQRYHIPDWRRGAAPSGEQETFNHLHSSIRNSVERAFGVWKNKWRILFNMPSYPMERQMMIMAATMCLHNFIRENDAQDQDFVKCDLNPDYVPTIPSRYVRYIPRNVSDTSTRHSSDRSMDKFRDDLARAIYLSRS